MWSSTLLWHQWYSSVLWKETCMKFDLEWRGLWKKNNPYTVLTIWGKPLRKSRQLKTAWFICSFFFSWLSALAFYGIKAEIQPSLLLHGTQSMAQVLTLSFAELSRVSERFWGNSREWTSYRNLCSQPHRLGCESAHGLSQGWVLLSSILSLHFVPCFSISLYRLPNKRM